VKKNLALLCIALVLFGAPAHVRAYPTYSYPATMDNKTANEQAGLTFEQPSVFKIDVPYVADHNLIENPSPPTYRIDVPYVVIDSAPTSPATNELPDLSTDDASVKKTAKAIEKIFDLPGEAEGGDRGDRPPLVVPEYDASTGQWVMPRAPAGGDTSPPEVMEWVPSTGQWVVPTPKAVHQEDAKTSTEEAPPTEEEIPDIDSNLGAAVAHDM
jgi:hypothetical protein